MKWPTTNLTPSPTNLLATDTPCFGSETSSPGSTSIFCPENAAGLVDVFGRLLDALAQLRPEGRVGPGDRSGDADLDLRLRRAREQSDKASGMDFRMAVRMLTSHMRLKG